MVKIFAISGDGIGAGKTTLARILGTQVWSLAGALRAELKHELPGYDWDNKSQEYKANTKVKERGNRSVRDVMIERGQVRCAQDPLYWVRKLADKLDAAVKMADFPAAISIDDVRKTSEINYLKERFPGAVTHMHLVTERAIPEAQFENGELLDMADYTISWER